MPGMLVAWQYSAIFPRKSPFPCQIVIRCVQESRGAAEAVNADVQQKLHGLSEGTAESAQKCGRLESRVTTLREELITLLAAESEARGDSTASLHAALETGLKLERFELDKVAEAVQVGYR
jgi:hypothetical protein